MERPKSLTKGKTNLHLPWPRPKTRPTVIYLPLPSPLFSHCASCGTTGNNNRAAPPDVSSSLLSSRIWTQLFLRLAPAMIWHNRAMGFKRVIKLSEAFPMTHCLFIRSYCYNWWPRLWSRRRRKKIQLTRRLSIPLQWIHKLNCNQKRYSVVPMM